MNHKTILTLLAFLLTISVSAQTRTVKGTVLDSETGAPVIGAAIIVGDKGVVTNLDGVFIIEIGSDDKNLKLSCLGYTEL